jgi:hypothetical protein
MRMQKNLKPNQVIQNQTNNQYNTYTMTSNELLDKTLEATNNEQNVITDIKDLPKFDLD